MKCICDSLKPLCAPANFPCLLPCPRTFPTAAALLAARLLFSSPLNSHRGYDYTSGKPCVYLFMLFVLFLLVASKKSKFSKSTACLGKAIPCTFYILFFSFLQSNMIFVQIGLYITSTFPLSMIHWYFLYFFDLIYLCKQSTCMMSLASTLASTGDYFFYFFAKKYEKQQKSTKSKNRVFLM